MVEIIFWALVFLVLYSYGIFQIILSVIGLFYKRNDFVNEYQPSVSIIISVFNEEKVIKDKIENTFGLSYPKDKIEIIIISDGSTDNTDNIIRSYEQNGVVFIRNQERIGKTSGLNKAVKIAKGEVVVFTDADSMFDTNALSELVKYYSDLNVGAVTGSTNYISNINGKLVSTTNLYTKLERITKKLESNIGSCVGADGAIFSIRKSLYIDLNNDDINDLVIPLNIIKQGYRVIYSNDARCNEEPSSSVTGAFNRQSRITNRTLRALFRRIYLLNVFKYPIFSFVLFSHKYIRFSVPFFLTLLIPVNVLLINYSFQYKILLIGQALFYLSAYIGYFQEKRFNKKGVFSIPYHFILVQFAVLSGWLTYFSGINQVTWKPRN